MPTWNYEVVHAHGRIRVIDDQTYYLKLSTTTSTRTLAYFLDGAGAWHLKSVGYAATVVTDPYTTTAYCYDDSDCTHLAGHENHTCRISSADFYAERPGACAP